MKAIKDCKLKICIEKKKNNLFEWVICAEKGAGISPIYPNVYHKPFNTVDEAKNDFIKIAKVNEFENYYFYNLNF